MGVLAPLALVSDVDGLQQIEDIAAELRDAAWNAAMRTWARCRIDPLEDDNNQPPPRFRASAVRDGKHSFESPQVAEAVGAAIWRTRGLQVNLSHYELEVVAIVLQGELCLGINLWRGSNKHFRAHIGPEPRPLLPHSNTPCHLRPSIAWLLIELAGVKDGDVVLDPFCGIGTIPLVAAAAFPCSFALAGDVDESLLTQAAANADALRRARSNAVNGFVRFPCESSSDASHSWHGTERRLRLTAANGGVHTCIWSAAALPLRTSIVDVVIVDLPFGIVHKIKGGKHSLRVLYDSALREVARVLTSGGRLVAMATSRPAVVEPLTKQAGLWESIEAIQVNDGGPFTWVIKAVRSSEPAPVSTAKPPVPKSRAPSQPRPAEDGTRKERYQQRRLLKRQQASEGSSGRSSSLWAHVALVVAVATLGVVASGMLRSASSRRPHSSRLFAMVPLLWSRGSHAQQQDPSNPPPCRPILRVTVRGGLNNQKECLINAGIAAKALNVTLALPHFDLIGHGNERFEPTGAKYIGPYADRERWGHFPHLFDMQWASTTLKQSLQTLSRIRPVFGGGAPYLVKLPNIANVTNGCEGFKRWQDTCEAEEKDKRLLERLIQSWRKVISNECEVMRSGSRERCESECEPWQLAPAPPAPPGAAATARTGAIVFDAGKSLCWNAYKSRFSTSCVKQFPFCLRMLNALKWNKAITALQRRVLRGIGRLRANATGVRLNLPAEGDAWASKGWAAVHVRAFVCAWNKRKPSFDHIATALSKLGVSSGILYVVSSVPVEQVQSALPQFTVIAKSTFLGRDVRLKYPFEVLAAVDYGVAVAAPHYLGEPMMSSFDAFASAERQRLNKGGVDEIAGACDSSKVGPGA